MNKGVTPYFTIASIVDQACIDLDIPVSHYFNKLLSWATWGLTELKMDTANEVITVKLPISDVCTVTLPSNFVDWVKIGIQRGQYVTTLSVNDQLSKIDRTTEDWNPSEFAPPGWLPNGTDVQSYGYQFFNYGGSSLYSIGGGLPHRGHYQIVRKNGCAELLLDSGLDATEIYLEYIGLGINACGETLVHPYIKEYVRAYIHHQWEKFKAPSQRSEAAIARTGRDLWSQEMTCRGRSNPIDPSTLLTISRKSYRLTNHA